MVSSLSHRASTATSTRRNLSRSIVALAALLASSTVIAETYEPSPTTLSPPASEAPERRIVHLSAVLAAGDTHPVRSGLQWRIFEEEAGADGQHRLVAQSSEASPAVPLEDGNFIVHAAFGLSGATKRISISGKSMSEKLVLNAGGLRIIGMLGDTEINPAKLDISIFVPEPGNSEAKLVVPSARSGDTIGLPEGLYHVVSTLLDSASNGSTSPTNSVVTAELKVQAGKLTDATLRHRAAVMTLKLVSSPGGEALANTAFTILTPGGDVIREMIGAFPSLLLAEGEYVAIARHDNKTYQTNFKVVPALDQDIEVLAH